MKLSLVLEVIEKGGNHIRKMTGDLQSLGRKAGPVAQAMDGVTRSGSRVEASTFRWMRATLRGADAFDRGTAAAARFAGRTGMKAIEIGARGAVKGIGLVIRKTLELAKATVAYGALAIGAGAGWLIGGTIKTASEFEQLQVALEGTEGSASKAKAAMAWVAKFAKDTPYQVGEVTDAFVRARGVGIDPMTGAMTKLGDAAGGARKTLMDAVEALADAQTGEFERLKEFNITTSVKGDKATFSYIDKAGKNASKSVTKSMGAIRDAVLDIFDEKYGGGMLRQSRTLAGIWNNIQDVITSIQLKVANAGFFDAVKGKLQQVLVWLNKLEADGTLASWAQRASDWLTLAVERASEFVEGTDWGKVGSEAVTIAKGFWGIALALAKIVELWSKIPSGSSMFAIPGMGRINMGPNDAQVEAVERNQRARSRLGKAFNNMPMPTGKALNDAWSKGLRSGPPVLTAPGGGGKPRAAQDGKLRVEVDFRNAPAGMRATTTTTAPGVSATTRTGYRGRANGGPA
jgi:hypothetical protein